MEIFLKVHSKRQATVTEKMSKIREELAAKNHRLLRHSMYEILQGIATRGHRDDGVPLREENGDYRTRQLQEPSVIQG